MLRQGKAVPKQALLERICSLSDESCLGYILRIKELVAA